MRSVLLSGLTAASLLAFTGCTEAEAATPSKVEAAAKASVAKAGDAKATNAKAAEKTQLAAARDAVPPKLVGKPAPTFKLTDASGKEHDLAAYKGKVVVLEWTEQGCPYVKRHYASGTMQKLAKQHEDKVVWLAVNSSYFVKADKTKTWKKDKGITYPVLMDPDGKVGRAYGAKTTPHMFVIDAEGKVAYEGAIDSDSFGESETVTNYVDDAVKAVLAGKKVQVPATRPYGCSVKYGRS
jgi:peroxiredoxin